MNYFEIQKMSEAEHDRYIQQFEKDFDKSANKYFINDLLKKFPYVAIEEEEPLKGTVPNNNMFKFYKILNIKPQDKQKFRDFIESLLTECCGLYENFDWWDFDNDVVCYEVNDPEVFFKYETEEEHFAKN